MLVFLGSKPPLWRPLFLLSGIQRQQVSWTTQFWGQADLDLNPDSAHLQLGSRASELLRENRMYFASLVKGLLRKRPLSCPPRPLLALTPSALCKGSARE